MISPSDEDNASPNPPETAASAGATVLLITCGVVTAFGAGLVAVIWKHLVGEPSDFLTAAGWGVFPTAVVLAVAIILRGRSRSFSLGRELPPALAVLVASAMGAYWFYRASGGSPNAWLDEMVWSLAMTLPAFALVRGIRHLSWKRMSAWNIVGYILLLLLCAVLAVTRWGGWIVLVAAAVYFLGRSCYPATRQGAFDLLAVLLPVILVVLASVAPILLPDPVLQYAPGKTVAGVALRVGIFFGFLLLRYDQRESANATST